MAGGRTRLYYAAANGDLMVVAFGGADPIEPAPPVRLFRACVGMAPMPAAASNRSWFDATPDGTRFLIACTKADSVPSAVTVSVDWTASLK